MHALTDKLHISGQITPADLAQAAAVGINTLIDNRPDGEEADQPDFADIRLWAQNAGIGHAVHQPVTAPALTGADAAQFMTTVAAADTPVLAYCRTGTRCALLWALHAVSQGMAVQTAIRQAANAGIDLSSQHDRLTAAAR